MSDDQAGSAAGGGRGPEGIGPKRLVVGAHYGLREWMVQRVTAIVLALYIVLLLGLVMAAPQMDYDAWAGLFVPTSMKLVTLIALLALFYHAWVGIRDIWMDYVKPTGIRLGLQVATILFLVYCAVWSVQILWRV
jgi:succinate dehydrogenase / fumarate reductase membrane anchor subunit